MAHSEQFKLVRSFQLPTSLSTIVATALNLSIFRITGRYSPNGQEIWYLILKWGYPQIIHFNRLFPYKLLVGGWVTPLKNMKVNWDDEIPNIWENKIHGNQTTNQILTGCSPINYLFLGYPIHQPGLALPISRPPRRWHSRAAPPAAAGGPSTSGARCLDRWLIGGFHSHGVPQNGWFTILEGKILLNLFEMDDLGVPPIMETLNSGNGFLALW